MIIETPILRKIVLVAFCLFGWSMAILHWGDIVQGYASVITYFTDPKLDQYKRSSITIGGNAFNAVISDSDLKRTLGLSGTVSLPSNQVMLFVFDYPDKWGIWMKDMLFPIDIMWFDENLNMVYSVKNVSPDTFPEVFEPKTKSLYVVEAKAGFIDENMIGLGSRMVIFK